MIRIFQKLVVEMSDEAMIVFLAGATQLLREISKI